MATYPKSRAGVPLKLSEHDPASKARTDKVSIPLAHIVEQAEAGVKMTIQLIVDRSGARELGDALRGERRIAVDLEAAGFHRYSDQVCLLQVSTAEKTFVVDALAVDPSDALRTPFESPDVRILVHGGDYDLRLLDRDLHLHPVNLFDTQVAAALLGEPSIGLASLLEKYFQVYLSKKYQRADWAQRPIPGEMLKYAASDTQHLHKLTNLLTERLESLGRLTWAEEESMRLASHRWSDPGEVDPVTKITGARHMRPREIALIREACLWRDEIARRLDRALFRVVGDAVLLKIVQERPKNKSGLAKVDGFSTKLAERSGTDLLQRLEVIDRLEDKHLAGYPRTNISGSTRPTPELEEAANRLKAVRNRKSAELGIERGLLMSNALLLEIARNHPRTERELQLVDGVRRWQVEALAGEILAAL